MQTAARPIFLVVVAMLALGSFGWGAVTPSVPTAEPAASSVVQTFASIDRDPSVPAASTVTFPPEQASSAPTF
jgi:hypothetical protein